MYFAEFTATAAGQRVFDIKLNGKTVASGVDVPALAGTHNTAVSVQILAFYSGPRSNFDVVFPTAVRFALLWPTEPHFVQE